MDNVDEGIPGTSCFNLEILCDKGGRMVVVDNEKRLWWGNRIMGQIYKVSAMSC